MVLKQKKLLSDNATFRLVSPIRAQRDELVEDLCSKLTQSKSDKYSFLNASEIKKDNEVMQIVKLLNSNQDDDCTTLIESWMSKSKLSLTYYLLANKDNFYSNEFLTKVIKNLSENVSSLKSEEVVALWLCLYLTKRHWSTEELYQHLNFDVFQTVLNGLLKSLSVAEISCIFSGMKKVIGLELYLPRLRANLYEYLASILEDFQVPYEDKDVLFATVLPILQQGSSYKSEETSAAEVQKFAQTLVKFAKSVKLNTLILCSYHLQSLRNVDNLQALASEMVLGIQSRSCQVANLSLNDIKKMLQFLARMANSQTSMDPQLLESSVDIVKGELVKISDQDCQLTDTRDLLQCLLFLQLAFDHIVPCKYEHIFQAINDMPEADFFSYPVQDLNKNLLIAIHSRLFPNSCSQLEDQFSKHFRQREDSEKFLRLIANLEQSYRILFQDEHSQVGQIEDARIKHVMKLVQKSALNVEDIMVERKSKRHQLTKRQRNTESIVSVLLQRLASKDNVAVAHILPHLQVCSLISS